MSLLELLPRFGAGFCGRSLRLSAARSPPIARRRRCLRRRRISRLVPRLERLACTWLRRARRSRSCRSSRSGGRRRSRLRRALALSLRIFGGLGSEGGAALAGTLLAATIVELMLAHAQRVERDASLATGIGKAFADDEALPAFRIAGAEARFGAASLLGQTRLLGCVAVGGARRRRQRRHCREQQASHAVRDANGAAHVNDVSTRRRASARNSDEPISRSRDTVRGNSCASGPSV